LIKRGARKPTEGGVNDARSLADRLTEKRRVEAEAEAPVAPEPPVALQSSAPEPEVVKPVEPVAPAVTSDTEAVVAAAKAKRAPLAVPVQRCCLIVDDSRVVRKVARRIAESLGYQVVEAENGEEALARCKAEMPDLVLTDWQMPVMSGIEFVTQLRAVAAKRNPTVVFCTSKGAAKDIHDGIAAGADDYVIKPFNEAQLKAKLEGLAG
jgi:CheY-like chemotaxis protein